MILYSIVNFVAGKSTTHKQSYNFAILLGSQALIDASVPKMTSDSVNFYLLRAFFDVTAILLVLQCIINFLPSVTFMNRVVTLLLYMYADSIEHILVLFDVNTLKLGIAGVVFTTLHFLRHKIAQLPVGLLVRAINITCINLIFGAVTLPDDSTRAVQFQNLISVLFLTYLLNLSASFTEMFEEIHSYAVWKCAAIVTQNIQWTEHEEIFVFCVVAVIVLMWSVSTSEKSMLMKILSLVAINATLNLFNEHISNYTGMISIFALLSYLIVTEKIISFFSF